MDEILVSLVMPIYNGEKYLRESLDSILSQTHGNWEFIIINEYGSNDGSMDILNEYASKDRRFRIIQNQERLGISESMNIGLRAANGKYIARMDSDDISLPERLEKQVRFLETHDDVAMCGTRVKIFGTKAFDWKLEYDPGLIDSNLLFYSPCVHPTIMMRTSFLRENSIEYNPNYKATEDYDLFSRIGEKGKISNVDEVLFRYRLNDDNTTFRNNDIGLKIYEEVIGRQCKNLGLDLTSEELNLLSPHGILNKVSGEEAIIGFIRLDLLLKRLFVANEHVGRYDRGCLLKTLNKRFTEAYYTVGNKCDIQILDRIYHNSILSFDSLEYERAEEPKVPLISIILPTYNSQDYLLDTIWSLVRQTEKRFELLIVNEFGSDDDTVFIANILGDERIHVIQNDERLGLADSLNKGMRIARGKYLARMDADDVSVPERFEKELSYMESNPKCGLCGSWQRHYSPTYMWIHRTSVDDSDIRSELIFNCDMCHSTVMMRKDVFVNNDLFYDRSIMAEDWDLWYRASDFMEIHNIPEILGDYREGVDNITAEKFESLSRESGILTARNIERTFGIDVDEQHIPYLTGWENRISSLTGQEYQDALEREKKLIMSIYRANHDKGIYPNDSVMRTLTRRWLTVNDCQRRDVQVRSIDRLFDSRLIAKCKREKKENGTIGKVVSKIRYMISKLRK